MGFDSGDMSAEEKSSRLLFLFMKDLMSAANGLCVYAFIAQSMP